MVRNSDSHSDAGASASAQAKKVGIVLLVSIVASGALGGVFYVLPTATNQGYTPSQPIPFSHKLHAGDNKIACTYCHVSAERSKHATVPSVNVCMNCHSVVKLDSPYIQAIHKHYQEGRPIEWVRVHELPDFVYFPHNRHVAKGVSCETCHGNVKGMEKVEQVSSLSMGWCVNCHRGRTTPTAVLANVYPHDEDQQSSIKKGPVAPINCSTCHF